jgi:hypothetical protein
MQPLACCCLGPGSRCDSRLCQLALQQAPQQGPRAHLSMGVLGLMHVAPLLREHSTAAVPPDILQAGAANATANPGCLRLLHPSSPCLPPHLPASCQSGDEECIAAWQRICDASRREFEAIYSRLGVTLQERGESFYNPMLKGELSRRQQQQ